MCRLSKPILNLIPFLIKKMSISRGPAYRVIAVGFSKRGNMLGYEMNGWRELATDHHGAGKHAEAALMKKYGKRVDKIYILRVGRAKAILPIHPCKACQNIAEKNNTKIYSIHELLTEDDMRCYCGKEA